MPTTSHRPRLLVTALFAVFALPLGCSSAPSNLVDSADTSSSDASTKRHDSGASSSSTGTDWGSLDDTPDADATEEAGDTEDAGGPDAEATDPDAGTTSDPDSRPTTVPADAGFTLPSFEASVADTGATTSPAQPASCTNVGCFDVGDCIPAILLGCKFSKCDSFTCTP